MAQTQNDRSKEIYAAWLARHQGTDRVSGSKSADMRSALVDYFRDHGRIMIATEAGAEGINLQFCSLVVNYNLPWNPQRIEQRIGRCHRYGQKHDVVVVNFLNRKNEADRRVFELLSEKFKLFDGVFGTSDEVLGAIESGVDFEKRIAAIYHQCRKPAEIATAFDQLQLELSFEIDEAMTQTRRKLLENFDDEVREKLRVSDEDSRAILGRFEQLLMRVTRHELADVAEFVGDSSFRLKSVPANADRDIPLGPYELPRRTGEAHTYRLNHPLAEALIAQARGRELLQGGIAFNYAGHEGKISALESLLGSSGVLAVEAVTTAALDQVEDTLVLVAETDAGVEVEEAVVRRLLTLPASATGESSGAVSASVDARLRRRQVEIEQQISDRNSRFFEAEAEKLDGWAEDLKVGLEREIKDLDRQIREAKRAATAAPTLEAKLAGQKQVKSLEVQRNQRRKSLFEAQDDIDRRRGELIAEMEKKLAQSVTVQRLFTVRWRLN